MLNFARIQKSPRQMMALTGVTEEEFERLVPLFEQILYETAVNKARKRAVGAGQKGKLKTAREKLLAILFYCKIYPTYDLAAAVFDIDRSRVCRWVKSFLPALEKVLDRTCSLPKRQINSIDELFECFPEVKDLFLDGVERPTRRPKKPKQQKRQYSGKKKKHTRKNIVITDEKKHVLYVSPTKNGKIHDFRQTKKTGILKQIPSSITLWVDKGLMGIKSEVSDPKQIQIPHKKPKGKSLTQGQKQDNKLISSVRIIVEHAIAGIKRFGCTSQIYRNHKGQDDQMMAVCSGLWNFHLQAKSA